MSEELRPCPFCGGEAAYIQILGNYERPHEVYCTTCDGGITEGRSKDGVIHNWNNRPIEDALTARIAELEAEIERLTVHSDTERQDDKCSGHGDISNFPPVMGSGDGLGW